MKTKILTIVAILGLVLAIGSSSRAETAKKPIATTLTGISNFSGIEAKGNVELYVTSGPVNQVKVYNNYYGENALVQNENGVLRITSYKPEKLVVLVTVYDLRAVTLYDDCVLNSAGKLGALDLNVNLYNNATANLNIDAISADVKVNDSAKANLIGTADECNLTSNQASTVNSINFASNHFTRNVTPFRNVSKNTGRQYAGL